MKKGLLLLFALFFSFVLSFAQQKTGVAQKKPQTSQASSPRMKFMGKSMNCSLTAMVTHLQSKGYTLEYNSKDLYYLYGNFQGFLNCEILLRQDYNILHFCRVFLPENSSWRDDNDTKWSKLESDYNDMVERYTQKYGYPLVSSSEFEGETPPSSFYKLKAVENEKCNYKSVFYTDGGQIIISIDSRKRVMITYYDDISYKKIKRLQNDEL